MPKIAIIIPARYASTRFPGKPLTVIAGKTMLERVVAIARTACKQIPNAEFSVATEDDRIYDYCGACDIPCVMTDDDCKTGSDRVAQAIKNLEWEPEIVLGLQGDAPFTPLPAVTAIIETFTHIPAADVVTPVVPLRWAELDALRAMKKITPFSGTTAIIDHSGRALWFSKNIIPAMRREMDLRAHGAFSPVFQHLGLYAFRLKALQKFVALPEGVYESLEGLEQLRMIENGFHVHTARLDIDMGRAQAGVDSPEDVARIEDAIARHGDPMDTMS